MKYKNEFVLLASIAPYIMLLGEDPRVNLAEPASAVYLTRMILIAAHVRSSKVQVKTLNQVASAAEGRCGAKSNS